MLNKITDKERAIQKALGLDSHYYIQTNAYKHLAPGGGIFCAVSAEDAAQQFVDQLSINPFQAPNHAIKAILQDIHGGHYTIDILPPRIKNDK